MININKAAAINAMTMNLTGTTLLSSRQRALSREQLLEQLKSYQRFLIRPLFQRYYCTD